MVRPLKFGNRLAISFHAIKLIDCLSVLAFKLIRVNNRGSWRQYEDHDIQDTISRRWLPKMGGSYHGLRGNHHGRLLSYLHHVCWTLQERVQPHPRGWLVKQAQASLVHVHWCTDILVEGYFMCGVCSLFPSSGQAILIQTWTWTWTCDMYFTRKGSVWALSHYVARIL